MPEPIAAAATQTTLYPLSEFYREGGRRLPPFEELAGEDVPPPYQELLVHDADMTSVLQRFHRQTIRLRPLAWAVRERDLFRQVALVREDEQPVEYGAIRIALHAFPADARAAILASVLPLGAILTTFDIAFESAPACFFRIETDAHIATALHLKGDASLYGRVNRLSTTDGTTLADVVEILPPVDLTEWNGEYAENK